MSGPQSVYTTIIISIRITEVAPAITVSVALVRVGYGGTVVAEVSLCVTLGLLVLHVGVHLVRVGHQGAVVLTT